MKNLYCFLLATYPITSGYGLSPQLDFGSILLLLFGIFIFIKDGHIKFVYPLGYKEFMWTGIIISIIFVAHVPFRLILFSVNLVLACKYVSWDTLWRFYKIVVAVSCIFFFVQEIASNVLNMHISGILSFIPTIYGYADKSSTLAELQGSGRSPSFFLEPSYFAQFLFPFIALQLYQKDKSSIITAIFVSVIVLLTKTGNGVALFFIIWGVWFIHSNISARNKIALIIVFLVILSATIYYQPDLILNISHRSNELTSYLGDEEYMSSGFIRFFRGYYLITDLPLSCLLFGASPTDIEHYMNQNTYFAFTSDRMINGLQTAITSHGLFVAILYCSHLLKYTIGLRKDKAGLVICICFMYLMLSESYFLSGRGFLTTIFIFCLYNRLYSNNGYSFK